MTRIFQRGSPTPRLVDDGWSYLEAAAKLDIDESPVENHGKDSLLIWVSRVVRRLLVSLPLKFQLMEGVLGHRNADMPDSNSSLRSLLNGSNNFKGLFSQLPDSSPFSFQYGQSNLTTLAHSASAQHKKSLRSPIAQIIMLSFISIFILVAVLGSSKVSYPPNPASGLIYSSYRKLHEDFVSLDIGSGGIFGLGILYPREILVCPKGMEHHTPCYNASLAGKSRAGGGLDRHCERSESSTPCLIRPPKNYTLPLQWPYSKNSVWIQNVKIGRDFKEIKTARIAVDVDGLLNFGNQESIAVEKHFQIIADVLGIPENMSLSKFGIQTALDIGCSYGAFVDHLLSRDVKTFCIAPYETHNSHVQIALDRGLPAMIGSLVSKQLPYPASSFNMVHCTNCGTDWSQKDGLLLLEVDRVLKEGGYFVWTVSATSQSDALTEHSQKVLNSIAEAAKTMCWASFAAKDKVFIWQKRGDRMCSLGSNRSWDICDNARNDENMLYGSLRPCLDAMKKVPSSNRPLESLGLSLLSEILDDPASWYLIVKNYWSIITPLLYSDHPKRPAEDDPLPPSNIVRNVMDMNAMYGGFNSALLEAGKSVWVMNVVPTSTPNTLPMIYERGLFGTLHDWCEPFPTYPRTYDLLHGIGLLSETVNTGCSLSRLLLEMDRILRPEGWVLLLDHSEFIEEARVAAAQMRWEARIIEVEWNDTLRLLVCQKGSWKD